jgi:hypothetical protein
VFRQGSDWRPQLVRRNLVGRIFWCSDRGLLLGWLGIGAQLGIGERGICYYTTVHTLRNGHLGFLSGEVSLDLSKRKSS